MFSAPLDERIAQMKAAKQKEQEEFDAHQNLIASRMAKMDEYIAQYEARKQKHWEAEQERVSIL